MKKLLISVLVVTVVLSWFSVAKGWTLRRGDVKIAKFHSDCNSLILGLQQYKEFFGAYPEGSNEHIMKSMLGRGTSEKKAVILAVRTSELNDKGEITDPWGTALQFYFSHNEVMIRSAGPNKAFEDSSVETTDDLYRTVGKK